MKFFPPPPSGWRDGTAVKSTGSSSTGPGFDSQHLTGSLQSAVSSSRRSDTFFWLLWVPGTQMMQTYMQENTNTKHQEKRKRGFPLKRNNA